MEIRHRPLSTALGGEIIGFDINNDAENGSFEELWQLFLQYQVLVIRDQDLQADKLISFSKRCGPIIRHPVNQFLLPEHPDIMIVSNIIENGEAIGTSDAGRYWHSDMTYVAEPPKCTLLYAVEIPQGLGDTLFANMYAAYETLPTKIRDRLLQMHAIHQFSNAGKGHKSLSEDVKSRTPPVTHPAVRTHPETGRKALYVHENNVIGLDGEDDPELLNLLYEHSIRDEFVYCHKWRVKDLVIWDNRCTMHKAIKDYSWPEHPRRMHRTLIAGDRPFIS